LSTQLAAYGVDASNFGGFPTDGTQQFDAYAVQLDLLVATTPAPNVDNFDLFGVYDDSIQYNAYSSILEELLDLKLSSQYHAYTVPFLEPPPILFTGIIDLSPTLSYIDFLVTGPPTITGIIDISPSLTGTFDATEFLALLRPEFNIVYGININSEAEVLAANVPDEKPFFVDAAFSGTGGNAFYDAGARQNYIGVRLGVGDFLFRAPDNNEVWWFVAVNSAGAFTPQNFYRFFAASTPVWHLYHPWPERAITGQHWVDILDPDRIYEYYARLTSHLANDLQDLNRQIARLLDPAECPDDWLDLLSEQHGIRLDLTDAPATQRKKLTELLRVPRLRGTTAPFIIPFRHEGYFGYVYEIWADPEDVTNWSDVAFAPASVVANMTAIGILDDQVTESGQKGIDFVVVPHHYFQVVPAPGNFWPTGRVAAMLRNLDGTPVGLNLLTYADVKELSDAIAFATASYLPAHADIRLLVEVKALGASTTFMEELEIDDTLATTDYEWIIDVTPVLSGTFVVTP
jgi:hypothetical protein